MPLKPPPLLKGDRIGVFSPAWFVPEKKLARATQLWESLGFQVYLHPQVTEKDQALAGDPARRAAAFHDLIQDPAIKAVIPSDGGYGCVQILEHLDFDLIRQHPKIILGYSDVSLLLQAIHAKTGLVTFHGPSFATLPTHFNHPTTLNNLVSVLQGETPTYTFTNQPHPPQIIQQGSATAPLQGGNHIRMKDLVGTPYLPDMTDCLFFTESNRPSYPELDGNLYHLRLAQALQPQAVLIGHMEMVHSHDQRPKYQALHYNLPLTEMLPKHFPDVPIVTHLPFGHEWQEHITFPLGIPFRLTAHKTVTLEQLWSATA